MKEQWILLNKQVDYAKIADKLGVPRVLVKLMVNRGISEEEMENYLHGDISMLANPLLMKGVKEATDIIVMLAQKNEAIAVVTDYDCDGIFSGMVLYTGLSRIGARPVLYTPDRVKDGYGINRRIIDEIYNQGINYIITCDNGIAAYDEIAYAKELGMTVIITDHHDVPYNIGDDTDNKEYVVPPADAVCNPKQHDCTYPYKGLCGAGVAYRLIDYVYSVMNIDYKERNILLQYTAIATIADIMEITGENRVIVKTGLNYLTDSTTPGLTAIKDVNDLMGKLVTVYHIGFIIGPSFNAAGRLQDVKPAFNLLLESDPAKARQYADELKELNERRKDMTEQGADRCLEMIKADSSEEKNRVLVIVLDDCHESVVGIIAGRVKDVYNKPVIVFSKVGNGLCKGSGRSIPAYDMFAELSACKDLFVKFGGHPMAAGITMKEELVEELKSRLNNNCRLTDKDMMPVIRIDAEVLFRHMSMDMIRSLNKLEPYGNGNPKPLFCARNVKVKRASIVGRNRNVLKLVLQDQVEDILEGVYFGNPEEFVAFVEKEFGVGQCDRMLRGAENDVILALTFYPDINEYNGIKRVQLVIQNYDVMHHPEV